MAIAGDGKTLWIGATNKLFGWDNAPEGVPHDVGIPTGPVHVLLRDGETLWIGGKRGLFRWNLNQQDKEPQRVSNSPESVASLLKVGTRLFVWAADGLSVLEDSSQEGFPPSGAVIKHIKALTLGGMDTVWVGSDEGLYRWDGVGEPVSTPLPLGRDDKITSLITEDGTLLIGTTKGLIRWVDAPNGKREWIFTDAEVFSLYKDHPMLLISTKEGLRRLDEVRPGEAKTVVGDIGFSYRYFRNGDDPILWMGAGSVAEAGLYRWHRQDTQPRRVDGMNTGSVFRFYKSGDTLWIGAERGLFRIDGQARDWNADINITSDLSNVFTNTTLSIQWKVGNFGWRTTPALAQYHILIKDDKGQEVQLDKASVSGKQELILSPLKEGTYKLYVQATDLNGKTAQSAPKEFTVHPAGTGILWATISPFLPYLIGTVLLLIVLSPRVILLLSRVDFLWINQLARFFYLRSFGRWKLFRKYRARLRASSDIKFSVTHYVDLPFEANIQVRERAILPDLFTELLLDKRAVIVADGGRGKSTLCHYLADRCVVKRDLFGGKLLEPVIVDGLMYAGDILKAVTNVLREGRAYINAPIIESQLDAGNLLVIFDGFSEIREKHLDKALEDIPSFIRQYPDTPFIFTSRSQLPSEVQQALNNPLIVTLRDVDESTQRVFFAKHLEGDKEEVEKEVDALIQELKDRLGDLPRIPLMLKLVATVYNQKRAVPNSTAALFDDYARHVLRPEKTNIEEFSGLQYAIHHLVRETYLRSGGDRGLTMNQGVEVLEKIKDRLVNYDIKHSPIKLLRVLITAGLYKEVRDNLRFFHDSFESYFAARALENDFREKRRGLLKKCANNDRLSETVKFLEEMITEPKERRTLNKILSSERDST